VARNSDAPIVARKSICRLAQTHLLRRGHDPHHRALNTRGRKPQWNGGNTTGMFAGRGNTWPTAPFEASGGSMLIRVYMTNQSRQPQIELSRIFPLAS